MKSRSAYSRRADGLGILLCADDVERAKSVTRLAVLSARERDVFELLAERRTNKEIALSLRLEVQTVKNHVGRVLRKLGLRSRYEAARATFEDSCQTNSKVSGRGGGAGE